MRKTDWRALFVVMVVAFLAAPLWAADEPRKIDFTQLVADLDGKPYTECLKSDEADRAKCVDEVKVTLGLLVSRALISRFQDEKDISLEEQSTRGFLAIKLYKAKEAVLTADQVVLLKKLAGKMGWPNIVSARVCVALDPACGAK